MDQELASMNFQEQGFTLVKTEIESKKICGRESPIVCCAL